MVILILNACLFYFMGLSARRAERPYASKFLIIALLRCVWAAAGAFFSGRRPEGPKVRSRSTISKTFYDFREFLTKIEFGVCFNILKYIKAHSKPRNE